MVKPYIGAASFLAVLAREVYRDERLHLRGSVSCSSLEVHAATIRDIIKMEPTVVVHLVSVS